MSIVIYKKIVVLNYYLDINDVIGFIYEVRLSFVVNLNYFDRKKYVGRFSFVFYIINVIDINNVIICISVVRFKFVFEKIFVLDIKYFFRFSCFRSFNVIISLNYNIKNS